MRLRGQGGRFVSRGGDKLAGALEDLAVDPTGLRCLDVGASTGGFTDCLLQAGAEQRRSPWTWATASSTLRLREDPRVHVRRTHQRAGADVREHVERLGGPVELVVAGRVVHLVCGCCCRGCAAVASGGGGRGRPGEAAVRGGPRAGGEGRGGARSDALRSPGGGADRFGSAPRRSAIGVRGRGREPTGGPQGEPGGLPPPGPRRCRSGLERRCLTPAPPVLRLIATRASREPRHAHDRRHPKPPAS